MNILDSQEIIKELEHAQAEAAALKERIAKLESKVPAGELVEQDDGQRGTADQRPAQTGRDRSTSSRRGGRWL
jgi:hypothetical protein